MTSATMDAGNYLRTERYQLERPLNISGGCTNAIANTVFSSFVHNPIKCHLLMQSCKTGGRQKLSKTSRGYPISKVLAFGKEFEKFCGPLLKPSGSLLICGPSSFLSEISSDIHGVASEIHILGGYWIGPDFDDGWGYVEAAILVFHQ